MFKETPERQMELELLGSTDGDNKDVRDWLEMTIEQAEEISAVINN